MVEVAQSRKGDGRLHDLVQVGVAGSYRSSSLSSGRPMSLNWVRIASGVTP
jgi:hypothetical protein